LAIENGTAVAARLVTRYVGDIGKNRQEQAAWVSFRSPFLFESEYVTLGGARKRAEWKTWWGMGAVIFWRRCLTFRILPGSRPACWTAVSGRPASANANLISWLDISRKNRSARLHHKLQSI